MDCKEIKPVNSKGVCTCIFIGRTDAEAEAPIVWSPDAKNQLIRKDPNAGKDRRQKEKGSAEDEIDSIINLMDMNLSKLWEIVEARGVCMLQFMGSQRVRHDLVTENQQQHNKPTANFMFHKE